MLNVPSRRLYFIYTISLIAALGMAMIGISNPNSSSPSAAFAAAEEAAFRSGLEFKFYA